MTLAPEFRIQAQFAQWSLGVELRQSDAKRSFLKSHPPPGNHSSKSLPLSTDTPKRQFVKKKGKKIPLKNDSKVVINAVVLNCFPFIVILCSHLKSLQVTVPCPNVD